MDNIDNLDEQKVSLPGAAAGETENVSATALENLNNNSCSSNETNTNSDNNNNNIDNEKTVIKDEKINNNLEVINENIENILNENQENSQEEQQNEIDKILENPITTTDDEVHKIPESGDKFLAESVQFQIETVDTVITEAAAAVVAAEPTKSELNFLNLLASIIEREEEEEEGEEDDDDGQDKPPVPLPTYCWEDLKRAKELGGYPWTHLYKEPLGPYDEPEIVIGLRTTPRVKKRVKQRLLSDSSPKTEKKLVIFHDSIPDIRCDDNQSDDLDLNCRPVDLLDLNSYTEQHHPQHEEKILDEFKENFVVNETEVIPSTSTTATTKSPLNSLKRIKFKPPKPNLQCCQPLVDKIKVMADKHFHSTKPPSSPKTGTASGNTKKLPFIKKVQLADGVHIPLKEEQKILRLKESPRAGGREISSYVERQDSDDIVDIVKLEESPQTAKKSKKEKKKLARSKPVPRSDALIIHIPLKPPKPDEDDGEEGESDEVEEQELPKIEQMIEEHPIVLEKEVRQEVKQSKWKKISNPNPVSRSDASVIHIPLKAPKSEEGDKEEEENDVVGEQEQPIVREKEVRPEAKQSKWKKISNPNPVSRSDASVIHIPLKAPKSEEGDKEEEENDVVGEQEQPIVREKEERPEVKQSKWKKFAKPNPVSRSDASVIHIPLKPPKSEEQEQNDEVVEQEQPNIQQDQQFVVQQVIEMPEELEPTVDQIIAEEIRKDPPQKAPRKKKEHVYEDIEDYIPNVEIITNTPSPSSFVEDNHDSIRASLSKQDETILNEILHRPADTYLDDEAPEIDSNVNQPINQALLAPISSIDSTSSDEDKRSALSTLSEEHSDCETVIENIQTIEEPRKSYQNEPIDIVEVDNGEDDDKEIVEIFKNKSILSDKSSLTRSPGSEKKVTFSSSTEENEESARVHASDLILASTEPGDGLDNSQNVTSNGTKPPDNRWSNMGDHEYEPVGEPVPEVIKQQQNGKYNNESEDNGANGAAGGDNSHNGDAVQKRRHSDASSTTSHERKLLRAPTEDDGDDNLSAQEYQNQIEDRFFNNIPSSTSRTDNEVHTSQVDSSAIEDLPLKREDRKRNSMMISIQDKGRNMHTKLRTQAGKVRTKLRGTKSKQPSIPSIKIESPVKVKERKKFKAPDFSKFKNINIPKFKKPDFKIPEFKKSISTQETTTTTPDNHKFVTVIERETSYKNEPRTFEVETTTVQSVQQAPVVITLPVDIPPPIEVAAPVPTQEKKSRFSRPEMPKFNFSDKFASLRSLKKDKSVVVDEYTEDKEETKEDLDKPAEPKKSRFSRPEMPKFNFAEKMSSFRSRDRSRSKSIEQSDKPEEIISALLDDEQLDFTEQKEQLTALSPPADEPISAPPILELQDTTIFVESTATSSSQPSTDPEPSLPVKKSRFTRPEFTRFNFSEKLASFRRSRSTDASQNKKDDEFEDDDEESIPPAKITAKKRFSKPELPKFKIPEKFSSLRLRRSKSFKETSPTSFETNETTLTSEPLSSDEQKSIEAKPTKKPLFDFDFGTYPRFLSKLKKQKKSDTATIDSKIKVDFPTMSKNAVRRMSFEKDNESGSYRPSNENEDINRGYREGSVEKRMRLEEIEAQERYDQEFSDEQIQLDEYDRENREIHEIAKSRYDQPLPVAQEVSHTHQKLERQESDWNSEDEKVLQWVKQKTAENKEFDQEDSDIHSDELDQFLKYSRDQHTKQREVTPYTNQETQSSGGSSGVLRGKGVIEEIDDDEFYLRKKGISQENIPINEYISSALREGLTDPINSLAQVGDYNAYYPNINTPSDKFNRSMESDEIEPQVNQQTIDNFFGTFSKPSKPIRRQKKSYSIDEIEDQQVPRHYYPTDETRGFYEQDNDDEQPPQLQQKTGGSVDNHQFNINLPPVAPKRRKKGKIVGKDVIQEISDVKPSDEGYIDEEYIDRVSVHEVFTKQFVPPPRWADGPSPVFDEIIVHQTQHEYHVTMAEVESFKSSPYPTGRTRSRSHLTDDDRTSHGAESLASDNMIPVEEPPCKISSDPRDAHGYAIIRKDTAPPRPPAPLRRKKSTQSLTAVESKFSTMPLSKQQYQPSTPPPSRPNRNYSTIIPSKPPRRKSVNSLNDSIREINDSRSSPDLTQYEELDDDMDDSLHRDLHSGDVINKMKHRPLPPPPRPPRTLKKSKKKPPQPDTSTNDDKFDHDEGGENILAQVEFDILPQPPPKTEEIDISTQTDAIAGEEDVDFMDDFEEELDEMLPELKPSNEPRTLQEILEKEQEAELERARQLAEAKMLDRGIQRFRESSQRNYSERSRASSIADPKKPSSGSIHLSRSGSRPGSIHGGSRPMTPAAILIEKRTATPSFDHGIPITEVKLTVQPIDLDDDIEDNEAILDTVKDDDEIQLDDDEKVINLDVTIAKQEMEKFRGSDEVLIPSGDDEDAVTRNMDIEDSPQPEPPIAPRRKKSSSADTTNAKDEPEREISPPQTLTTVDEQTTISQQTSLTQPSAGPVERLQVSELDVDRLNVNALHANQIIVSELQSMAVNTQDIECKSGNLAMRSIGLPPGFIDEIVDRLSSQLQQHQQQLLEQQQLQHQEQQQQKHIESSEVNTQMETINTETPARAESVGSDELPPVPPPPSQIQKIEEDVEELLKITEELIEKTETQDTQQETPPPPERPPPPDQSHFYQEFFPYSIPPPSFYQLRNPSDEEPSIQQHQQQQPTHSPTHVSKHRLRRHQRKQDSTSEEEYQQREQNRNARGGRHGTRSPEPSIPELGGQLIRACSTAVQRSCRQILTALRDGTTKEIESNNEFHVAIIIVIIIVAGLILFGMGQGNKTVHLHHWDYFNPPGSGSEQTQ